MEHVLRRSLQPRCLAIGLLTALLAIACSEEPSKRDGGVDQRLVDRGAKDQGPDEAGPMDTGRDHAEDVSSIDLGPDLPPPLPPMVSAPAARCADATRITLVDGRAAITGSLEQLGTPIAPLMVCGDPNRYERIGYYRVRLEAGQHYRFSMEDHLLYHFFPPTVACDPTKLAAACDPAALHRQYFYQGRKRVDISPSTTGDYLLALSPKQGEGGLFRISIERLGPKPENDDCKKAPLVRFDQGRATIRGSATVAADPFSDPLYCWGEPWGRGNRQLFYRIPMTKGHSYSFKLPGSIFYLVDAPCDHQAISAACRGNIVSSYLHVTATRTSEQLLAVAETGPFVGEILETAPPDNSRCADAERLTFTGKVARVRGSTVGAENEHGVNCVGQYGPAGPPKRDWYGLAGGPQVYYRVLLQAGQRYRIAVASNVPTTPYVFSAAANCQVDRIEEDCNSNTRGARLSYEASAQSREITFSPDSTAEYIIAIDSSYNRPTLIISHGPMAEDLPAGEFELVVEALDPAVNAGCANATAITLVNGKATVTGNSGGLTSDLAPTCGDNKKLVGTQLYYSLDGQARTAHRLRLQPSFDALLYVIDRQQAGCDEAAITAACATAHRFVPNGDSDSLTYHLEQDRRELLIGVETAGTPGGGSFRLEVESRPHVNDRCSRPQGVTLVENPTVVKGDTGFARDEYGGVSCGGTTHWTGGQLYYKLPLEKGKHYTIGLESSFDGALYAFPIASPCTGAAIDNACKGSGLLGSGNLLHSDLTEFSRPGGGGSCGCGTGTPLTVIGVGGENFERPTDEEWLHISPDNTSDWVVVVDSWSPRAAGPFTLRVHWR